MNTPSIHVSKGRAIAARPLLCVGLVMLFLGALAPAARADLPAPVLTSTNPISPGESLTPTIKGLAEGTVTSALTFGASGFKPITLDVDPNDTVRIFTSSSCAGAPVGDGTVAELEGEGVSLDAPVAPDSTSVFYADLTNGAEDSECSAQGLTYRQVSTPPSTPSLSGTNPASGSNQNFPRLIGTASADATVSIYANASCSGGAAASGSAAQFGSEGIQVAVLDNSETTFTARASIAGYQSGCSAPITYTEVTPPSNPGGGDSGGGAGPGGGGGGVAPDPSVPRLRTIPGGSANDNTPRVTGTADNAKAVWIYASPECDSSPVAKGSAAEFAAGIPIGVADNTVVVFSAISVAGSKFSKCSNPVTYVEDSLSPKTRITMGPAAKTAKRRAIIRFTDSTGSLPGTKFLCRVDRKKWKQCSSPLRLSRLKPRRHVVRVKAIDAAGNAEPKGAKRSFKVVRRS